LLDKLVLCMINSKVCGWFNQNRKKDENKQNTVVPWTNW
jgi:hypothetical protein